MGARREQPGNERGATYIEVLVAGVLMAVSLLAMCNLFVLGYANVTTAGKTTNGVAAARQVLEDVKLLPYDRIGNLDGFDTDDPSTLPTANPEREVARRWRYALAGEGVGWTFSDAEKARWTNLAVQGDTLDAAGTITVVPQGATLTEVTIRVSVPGRFRDVQLSTLITRM